jgi:hypothetical protein
MPEVRTPDTESTTSLFEDFGGHYSARLHGVEYATFAPSEHWSDYCALMRANPEFSYAWVPTSAPTRREVLVEAKCLDGPVYVVEGPSGSTESLGKAQVEALVRAGVLVHVRDGHVLVDGAGVGVGAMHRFYRHTM